MKTFPSLLTRLALVVLLGYSGIAPFGAASAQAPAGSGDSAWGALDQRLGRAKQGLGLLLTNARANVGWMPRGLIKTVLEHKPRALPGPRLGPEEWEMSPYYREGLSYRPGLTRWGAKYMAESLDEQRRLDKLNWDHRDSFWVRAGATLGRAADPLLILLVSWLLWRLFRRITRPREYADPFHHAEHTQPFTALDDDLLREEEMPRPAPETKAPQPDPTGRREPSFDTAPRPTAAGEAVSAATTAADVPVAVEPSVVAAPNRGFGTPLPPAIAGTRLLEDAPAPLPDSALPISEPMSPPSETNALPSPSIPEIPSFDLPPVATAGGPAPSPSLPVEAESEQEMLLRLAEQGNVHAQLRLADRLLVGAGVERDPKAATSWIRNAAQTGVAAAQRRLGALYDSGQGVNKDAEQAGLWYGRAAEQGDAEAQYRLARMTFHGRGVARDVRQAIEWLKRAAHQGVVEAKLSLAILHAKGVGVERDPETAILWLRAAAEDGDPEACMLMGEACDEGRLGLAPNVQQALFWHTRARG